MPVSECHCCGGKYYWKWEEAFDKFGFVDGDGQVETWRVEAVLTEAGYAVETVDWGCHNTIIISIKKDGTEHMPSDDSPFKVGYDDPRKYLPPEIVRLLDAKLPEKGEV